MPQIVLLGTLFSDEQTKELQVMAEHHGYTVLDLEFSEDESALKECEILCGHCSEKQLKNAKKLRWIQLTSAGVDGMSSESIYPHSGIILTNATGVFGISIAEYLLMGALMLLRKMPQYICQQRKKQWKRAEGLRFLHGSKVTVLGTGDLGGTFAEYCRALGAIPTGVSRSGTQKEPFFKIYKPDQIAEAVKEADIVVSCLPGTRETEGIVSADVIASMQPGVLFLNAGRGRTVDEEALVKALQSGQHRGLPLVHRIKAIFWWCYMHTENPLPAAEILRVMPTDDEVEGLFAAASSKKAAGDGPEEYGSGIMWNEFHMPTEYRR